MRMSEGGIAQLAAALAGAQAEIRSVQKDRENSHFRNKYATLDSIMETVRPTLAKHGLSIVQGMCDPRTDDSGRVQAFVMDTLLLHASGEWLENSTVMPVKESSAQAVGSALTYGRRYGVSALLALATDEDDDGNAATGGPTVRHETRGPVATHGNGDAPTDKQRAFLAKLMQSSVFTDKERHQVEVNTTSKARAKDAIEWAQKTIDERKASAAAGVAS